MAAHFSEKPQLIDHRENPSCEYKAELSRSYLKVACAFANYGTGTILFGVDDEGRAVGLEGDLRKLCLDIENQLNDSIVPRVRFTLNPDSARRTIALTVYEGFDKPYTYRGKAYRRSDSSAVPVDQQELRRLSLSGVNQSFDALRSNDQKLRFQVLNRALMTQLDLEEVGLDTYKTLGLYTTKGESGYTNAAAMLADANEFSGVRIVGFGESISIITLETAITHSSAITQYEKSVECYRERYHIEVIRGIQRQRIELVPETAFREALANAIIHRNWDTNENINVAFFPDRIEVLSPGSLPDRKSVV